MDLEDTSPNSILDFWFSEPVNKLWFKATPAFDAEIRIKFEAVWKLASNNELDHWRNTPPGTLALIIILDQFPLNMFRGIAKCFSTEKQAIKLSHYAITNKFDTKLPSAQLAFLYMPLMHSENLADQDLSVAMFAKAGLDENLRFAQHHRNIIQQFSRFPHRNEILNRTSTKEELEYLASPKAFKG